MLILFAWFDHLEERFSYKEVLFKKLSPPAKTSWLLDENVNEAPVCVI